MFGRLEHIVKTFSTNSSNKEEFYTKLLTLLNSTENLCRPSDVKVLAIMCSKIEFSLNPFTLTYNIRKEIESKLSLSPQSISNTIARLKKLNLLNGSNNEYTINIHLFWNGTIEERDGIFDGASFDILYKLK